MKYLLHTFYLFLIALMFSCKEDPDRCLTTTCYNGAECVDGHCNCPDGFYGSNCQSQEVPVSMKITKVKLWTYPSVNTSGGYWDSSGSPDMFPAVNFGSSMDASPTFHGSTITTTVSYLFGTFSWIIDWDQTITMGIFDDDSADGDDYMGGITLTPSDYINQYPDTIDVYDGDLHFVVYVSWQYS